MSQNSGNNASSKAANNATSKAANNAPVKQPIMLRQSSHRQCTA